MKKSIFFTLISLFVNLYLWSQSTTYWQQHVSYEMFIDMDVNSYQYNGQQRLIYTNNSPDTLRKVYYHLYFNAFQPDSEMDVRSRTIADPDGRVKDRISKLSPDEIGFIKIKALSQNGKKVVYNVEGTVLVVNLANAILPGQSTTFTMEFDGQVPVHIRRSGRNNKEGVALSMAQWYPKLAEYDYEGWHTHPYIGREFHGVWGDFDVKITIDKDYVVGGTGYLQNPNKIGHGYETKPIAPLTTDKLTWHFKAPNVHDFSWAADPNYIHDILPIENGPTLHFLYKNDLSEDHKTNWKKLQPIAKKTIQFYSDLVGDYPYKQYSIIQAGDGGMEYQMNTFVTGKRNLKSLVAVTVHEIAHAWFQGLLATNELKYYWMDEGFTSYVEELALAEIYSTKSNNLLTNAYKKYISLVLSKKEQPLSTHADRFQFNRAYGDAAYNKGAVFLSQLAYIIGERNLDQTLKYYFKNFAFKHPTPNDFIRCAEKVSGIHLNWYLQDWIYTTNTIDYGIEKLKSEDNKTIVILKREGLMPMPIDLKVEYKDGTITEYYIPLQMMRGEKPLDPKIKVLEDWTWAYPEYSFVINAPKSKIKKITIDPNNLMADINKYNNTN